MAQGDVEESVEPALDSQIQPCHGTEKEMMSYCMVKLILFQLVKNFLYL